jgi:hypothetical protein
MSDHPISEIIVTVAGASYFVVLIAVAVAWARLPEATEVKKAASLILALYGSGLIVAVGSIYGNTVWRAGVWVVKTFTAPMS